MAEILNLEDTLERINHDTALCLAVLKEFVRSHHAEPSQMDRLIENNHIDDALKKAHSMKGMALNLGAHQLSEVAKSLELALKNQDVSLLNQLQNEFAHCHRLTLVEIEKAIEQLEEQQDIVTSGSTLNRQEIHRDIQLAQIAFDNDYAEALNLVENLCHRVSAQHYPELHRLLDTMRIFDVIAAKQMLAQLVEHTGTQS